MKEVGDEFWRKFVLVTSWRCWWPIFLYRMSPTLWKSHQYLEIVTLISSQTLPTSQKYLKWFNGGRRNPRTRASRSSESVGPRSRSVPESVLGVGRSSESHRTRTKETWKISHQLAPSGPRTRRCVDPCSTPFIGPSFIICVSFRILYNSNQILKQEFRLKFSLNGNFCVGFGLLVISPIHIIGAA